MKYKNIVRFTAYIMSFVLLLSTVSFSHRKVDAAGMLEQLQNTLDEIERKKKENEQKLASLQSDINNKEAYIDSLNTNIQYTQNQIDNLSSQIDVLNAQIKEVEDSIVRKKAEREAINLDINSTDSKIKKAEKEVKKAYEGLSARLRSSYITGEDVNLKLLLGSDTIATFLTRLEMMKRISENDAKRINDFKAEVEVLKLSKDSLEERTKALKEQEEQIAKDNQDLYTKRADLNRKMFDLNSRKSELDSSYKQVSAALETLDKNSAYYKNLILRQEQELAAADAAIERFLATQGSKTDGNGTSTGSYMFPLNFSGVHVTSGFGWRTLYGQANNHGGIDLSAPNIYGASIYASRGGTVVTAEKYSNSGYGHYVIIDHGDGYATLYGHCSTVLVNAGQTVNQGDVIARVGSTGNSTGPHLHFEVRKNGVKQNPLNYVSVP